MCLTCTSQVNYTANDLGHVPAYNGYFLYGTNGGYYGSSWDDQTISDIAAGNAAKGVKGVGSKTFRPPLPDYFTEFWGYDVRIAEFNHYATLGAKDHTVILGFPATDHKDNNTYGGCTDQSQVFSNLYTPIWDNGANGTPYNDDNYFAAYVYNVVSRYKGWVKFWEIVNEPDFDVAGNGWKDPSLPGNWWTSNPSPCDLANLKAPIFYYIRMLRIAYDVIKTLDPTAYICTGGLGFTSFCDAICRNTDNPVDGSVTPDYPLTGGAYFDCLSYHSYPMYNLAAWDNNINGFAYFRHSDAAADAYVQLKNDFNTVLVNHGYDDATHPKKLFICTENNIPKVSFTNYIGSDLAQKNYITKALVESQINAIRQYYIFVLGDAQDISSATDPYAMMGLYLNLTNAGPFTNGGNYLQQYTNEGIAYKTCSDILLNFRYDAARTTAMTLPANIGGGAFRDTMGNYVYVLWARTTSDLSEANTAIYSFPAAMTVAPTMFRKEWDFSMTGVSTNLPSIGIPLTATPSFFSDNLQIVALDTPRVLPIPAEREFALSIYPNPASKEASIKFTLKTTANVRVNVYDGAGKWVGTAVPDQSFRGGTHIVPLPFVQTLPSGVYYCRFETDIIQIMKKLVIVK
jgi:hypothetical protein